eukprot:14183440-Alexandrium_andersonii.AAC.1
MAPPPARASVDQWAPSLRHAPRRAAPERAALPAMSGSPHRGAEPALGPTSEPPARPRPGR